LALSRSLSYFMLVMRANERSRRPISPRTAEQASCELTLDLVGLAEAAELAGVGRAALSLRRKQHFNFPMPVAELDATGADAITFVLAPNPGEPPRPLARIASGGELSRVALALKGVLAEADTTPTLVFDEVDAGIGGHTARAVGERLRALGGDRQVLCITHLPQIAALADRHFRIEKQSEGDLARATVSELDGGQLVEELCRMLGADAADPGARRHAEALLA